MSILFNNYLNRYTDYYIPMMREIRDIEKVTTPKEYGESIASKRRYTKKHKNKRR